ncbi:ribonuclease H family protein [Tissierella pigra]|uniref:ribonuclease H n=1 Tax=Tissierella pigra TaxID=2607614 RepID=A0A6N7XRZ2_9FIRM|nr:ribonuclease H family protein [Tissierella pigra]MBU5425407.1 ribonuclease H family protein [Tissierella pigra]MSU00527.1 RNase H [Tissierella pigra]
MAKFYYGVRKGRFPGIYETWKKCEEQIRGYSGAEYKKFPTYEEALMFIDGGNQAIDLVDEKDLKENEAIAYVDGSFDIKNFTYSYGVVFIDSNRKETYSGRDNNKELAEMRNVSGEIKGAMVAMELAIEKRIKTLYLHFDYTGIEQWAIGSWKTNKNGTKAYKEFYDSIKDKLKVVFIKVKGHSGVKYNEEADKLAKEAIME